MTQYLFRILMVGCFTFLSSCTVLKGGYALIADWQYWEAGDWGGRPLAPENLRWQKNGVSPEQVNNELAQCYTSIKDQSVSSKIVENMKSVCMIKNGFQYFPRGVGTKIRSQNYCLSFREGNVACIFNDGKIILNKQGAVVWKKTGKEVDVINDFSYK